MTPGAGTVPISANDFNLASSFHIRM
jgi:hypothetical protein